MRQQNYKSQEQNGSPYLHVFMLNLFLTHTTRLVNLASSSWCCYSYLLLAASSSNATEWSKYEIYRSCKLSSVWGRIGVPASETWHVPGWDPSRPWAQELTWVLPLVVHHHNKKHKVMDERIKKKKPWRKRNTTQHNTRKVAKLIER